MLGSLTLDSQYLQIQLKSLLASHLMSGMRSRRRFDVSSNSLHMAFRSSHDPLPSLDVSRAIVGMSETLRLVMMAAGRTGIASREETAVAVSTTASSSASGLVQASCTASGTSGRDGNIFGVSFFESLEALVLPDIFSVSRAGPSGSDVTEYMCRSFDGSVLGQDGLSNSDMSTLVSGIKTMPTCCCCWDCWIWRAAS